jgi:serine/threonine protein kinase
MGKKRAKKPAAPTLPHVNEFPEELAGIRDHLSNDYVYDKVAGEGRTGIAYRLHLVTNPSFPVCLKTIKPSVTDASARKDIADTLEKEVKILSTLQHRCLPAILEYDFTADPPYYISTYHPGQTSVAFRNDGKQLSSAESFYVISELIDVIEYTHSHGRTHCDLHGGNILISEHVFRDGVLIIDFGSGHRESDPTPDTKNRGNAGFKPPESLRLDRQTVNRDELDRSFRQSDVTALGRLLIQLEDCLVAKASSLVKKEYRRFCSELQRDADADWSAIRNRLSTFFDPLRCVNDNADLFLLSDSSRDSFTLPIVHDVEIDTPSLAVIQTPEFQRLRNIKQLSFCDWHFPGAVHTRVSAQHRQGQGFQTRRASSKRRRARRVALASAR